MSERKEHRQIGRATEHDDREPVRRVRTDGSFDGLPFFLVSTRRDGRRNEMRFERMASYVAGGIEEAIDQRWTVRAAGNLGLPGRFDQDIYMAVHEVLRERGGIPTDGTLQMSMYELSKWLWSSEGGKQYNKIRESLNRIALTTIESEKAFWSARSGRFVSDSFSIWTFHRSDYWSSPRGRAADRQVLRFHPLFIENYEDNYLNELDSEFYWSLTDHGAKRLYRLLENYASSRASGGAVWECDLFELRDLIPLGNYQYASKIQQVLAGAHEELRQKGFLSNVSVEKVRKGSYSVRYELAGEFTGRRAKETVEVRPENQAALDAMRRAGIKRGVIVDVLRKHDPETCTEFASLLPYKTDVREPGAALRWALKNPDKGREWLWKSAPPQVQSEVNADIPETTSADKSKAAQGSVDKETDTEQNAEEEAQQRDVEPVGDQYATEVWEQVLQDVGDHINAPSLRVWFEGTVATHYVGGKLTVSVPNSFAKSYIESRFWDHLVQALTSRYGAGARLELMINVSAENMETP